MVSFKGKQGKTISADENFVTISQKSIFFGTSVKKIPLRQISSVEIKKPGLMAGYIQIAEIGTSKNKGLSSGAMQAALDENSVLFNWPSDYEAAMKVKTFIEEQMAKVATGSTTVQALSPADEITKFKGLLDQGIISAEEFEAKKKQLLGL
jgi:hypothetical protein